MNIKSVEELNEERQQLLAKQISLTESIKSIANELGIKPKREEIDKLSAELAQKISELESSIEDQLKEYELRVNVEQKTESKDDTSTEDTDFD
nr:MAG TPA: Transcriptional regulator DsbA [Caudoviricetes sp.]